MELMWLAAPIRHMPDAQSALDSQLAPTALCGPASRPRVAIEADSHRGPIAIDMARQGRDAGKGRDMAKNGPRRRFLSVWYRCCHVYGRMYCNAEETEYQGRCPRCGAPVRALIGHGGTDRRSFTAE